MKYLKDLSAPSPVLQDFDENFSLKNLLLRPSETNTRVAEIVADIEQDIQKRGDEAIRELTERLDGVELQDFLVSGDEFDEIEDTIDPNLKEAILLARDNITRFHKRQIPIDLEPEETSKGVYCFRQFRPIERVGLYVPGGTAPLFSSILMLGIPAILAGCQDITICTPIRKDGKVAPEILYTASILGIRKVFKIGGAQAIFAMAYGTDQVEKVDKIFGPGNAFVTEAKKRVSGVSAIDMPAGPSEVLVIADASADTRYVAADLLSQCEHGPDSQSVLISDSVEVIRQVASECKRQIQYLSRREIAEKSLINSFAILVDDMNEAIRVSNIYAPEHLILQVDSWEKYLDSITNAGSVFCGAYSPEAVGDYCSGTNHTLPTNGFARSYSGIGLESFGKWITFQEVTKAGLQNIGLATRKMAESEGLDGHKNAVQIRMERE